MVLFFKIFGLVTVGLGALIGLAQAQTATPLERSCLEIVSDAPYRVFGHVNTADGVRSNFRLDTGMGVRFCFSGPLFPGNRIELTTKTLIPTFSCYTQVNRRIIIRGERLPEGGTKTWANCT